MMFFLIIEINLVDFVYFNSIVKCQSGVRGIRRDAPPIVKKIPHHAPSLRNVTVWWGSTFVTFQTLSQKKPNKNKNKTKQKQKTKTKKQQQQEKKTLHDL